MIYEHKIVEAISEPHTEFSQTCYTHLPSIQVKQHIFSGPQAPFTSLVQVFLLLLVGCLFCPLGI